MLRTGLLDDVTLLPSFLGRGKHAVEGEPFLRGGCDTVLFKTNRR